VGLLLHYGDLLDGRRLSALLAEIQQNAIYHLAAQSHVRMSFDRPEYRPNRRIDVAGSGVRNTADWAGDGYAGECPATLRLQNAKGRYCNDTPRESEFTAPL
jgi:nucleoside-diphosphate-sugar epimerase